MGVLSHGLRGQPRIDLTGQRFHSRELSPFDSARSAGRINSAQITGIVRGLPSRDHQWHQCEQATADSTRRVVELMPNCKAVLMEGMPFNVMTACPQARITAAKDFLRSLRAV